MNLKKVFATGAAISALLLNSGAVYADAEADASVGDDGTAYSYTEDNDNFVVENDNVESGLFNLDLGIGVSGFNSQDGNDDDNSLGTGDSEGTAESENFLNSNVSEIEDEEGEGTADSEAEVGEDGTAYAYAYDNDTVTVTNGNNGRIHNFSFGLAISGLNSQSGNDDGNEMDTGDSDAMAETLNELNSNWTMVGGSNSAHATATVGDDGTAYAYAKDDDTVLVENTNSADLLNISAAVAVSGLNSQSGNDDDNSLDTGDSTAESSANNFVNSNVTVVGSGSGSATADASVGEDGNANSYSYDNDSVTVSNDNDAEVMNVSAGVAVSGGNEQSGNDDGNTLSTGSSSGSSCSSNTVNSNWTAIGSSLPEGGEGGCE